MNKCIWYPINSLERHSVILELTVSATFGKQNPKQNIILLNSTFYNLSFDICDLSQENIPNGSRSNAERNGKQTGNERLGKPFETGNVNRWTANQNFQTDEVNRMNSLRKFSKGWHWMDERVIEIFERMRSNGWMANEFFKTDEVEQMNGKWVFSNR